MKFTKQVFQKAQPQFGNPALYCWFSDIWLPLIIQRKGFAPHGELPGFQVGLKGPTFHTLQAAKAEVRRIAKLHGSFRGDV